MPSVEGLAAEGRDPTPFFAELAAKAKAEAALRRFASIEAAVRRGETIHDLAAAKAVAKQRIKEFRTLRPDGLIVSWAS